MTLAIELAGPGQTVGVAPSAAPLAPADAIPVQSGPSTTVSLTQGCEGPLEALKTAAPDSAIRCHPCDEAVVRLLMRGVCRADDALLHVTAAIRPGTLSLG